MKPRIKIERGVPVPPRCNTGGLFPWQDMKAGDSFFTAIKTGPSAAYKAGRRLGWTFTVRAEGKGWRIWRTK